MAVDEALYLRGCNGQNSRWYQAAVRQKAERIAAAGRKKEVSFETMDGAIHDRIDGAYRAKYKGSQYRSPIMELQPRSEAHFSGFHCGSGAYKLKFGLELFCFRR